MYYVYILVCLQTGRSYVGQTENLIHRYHRHLAGSTRTTRDKLLVPMVIYWEQWPSRTEAMRRERYFKAGTGHRMKCRLIADGMKAFEAME